MRINVQEVVLDCADIEAVAAFWSRLLARPWALVDESWAVVDASDTLRIGLQPVPEGKTVKNRVHLDLEVDDLGAAVAHAEACGALVLERLSDRADGTGCVVLADVEGNEFCLVRDSQRAYADEVTRALNERGRTERP